METIFDKPLDKQVTSNTQAIANLEKPSHIISNVVCGGTHNTIGFCIPQTAKTAKIVKVAPLGLPSVTVNLSLTLGSSISGLSYINADQTGVITDGKTLIELARYYSVIVDIELTY